MNKDISVIGLGKLGAPLCAALASRNFNVIGVDNNQDYVNRINNHQANVEEPHLQEYLDNYGSKIKATSNYTEAVEKTNITLIIVPTPSEEDGWFTTKYVEKVIEDLGHAIKNKKGYHLFVVVSTVLPGSMDDTIRPLLEKASGKKCGVGIGLCYNPEFIAIGSVIWNLLNPDLVLIGESDELAGSTLQKFYTSFCTNTPVVKRMSFVNAEITKISINSYVTMKISFANMLAELCENIPGGNVSDVTEAVGSDTRIGQKYLKGALGYGGPCFPRDNRAIAKVCQKHGVLADLPIANDLINNRQVSRIYKQVKKEISRRQIKTIAIAGLSYKPDTPVIEESQAVMIAKQIAKDKSITTIVYDPQAMDSAKTELPIEVKYVTSFEDCLDQGDMVLICTPWAEFKSNMAIKTINQKVKNLLILDLWGMVDSKMISNDKVTYHRIGVNYLND